jgi:hypothetical protein
MITPEANEVVRKTGGRQILFQRRANGRKNERIAHDHRPAAEGLQPGAGFGQRTRTLHITLGTQEKSRTFMFFLKVAFIRRASSSSVSHWL